MFKTENRVTVRSGSSRRTFHVLGAALLLICFTWSAGAAEKGASPLSGEWKKALGPLYAMPVQDSGYVRSAFTFGENHLMAIADAHAWQGMDALEAVLYLMANPEEAHSAPLIKVVRPELAKLYGAKKISLHQYRDPELQQKLGELIQRNQQLMNSVNDLESRAVHLEELENDFAIQPRTGEWTAPAGLAAGASPQAREIAQSWAALKKALIANDPQAGGEAARALAGQVLASAHQQKIGLPRLGLDVFYHKAQPFAKSALFYVLAALAYGGALLFGWRRLTWAGYALLALGFAAQLVGIASRWILAGRAPLSNMYESFTFAIAGMILVALIFELIYKIRLAGLGAAILGFIFMVLAHKAPIFDSQIRPLMPALQSSWLTYHVVIIMLSYSAFALSCFVSLTYLFKDALGADRSSLGLVRRLPSLDAMDTFNYKIIAVGFPLLTVGIILGAVWAATAWGRPWGFDPKETWSAITWLIYAIYLHVRYLAGWKGRRAAILALIGFVCVLFTYLGVNYLLPGLHSYAG